MKNRIRNYDFINKTLQEEPPIIEHKNNVSELTIFNAGYTEGYTEGYEQGSSDISIWQRYTLAFFLILGFAIGLSIGIWLP